jgi:GxxExxY protein
VAAENFIESDLTRSVIGAFFEVYNTLGFGFSERVYSSAMQRELTVRGHHVDREVAVHVRYKGAVLCHQRVDMLVDDKLILEIKSTTNLPPTSIRQLTNYLRATDLELGLVLHFGPQARIYRQILTNDRKPKYDL